MRRRLRDIQAEIVTQYADTFRRLAGGVGVDVVPVKDAARMVTLEDPDAGAESARGAFARLRPAPGMSPENVSRWRDSVAAVAKAVRVLPTPQDATVPVAAERPELEAAADSNVRAVATELAAQTERTGVVALVAKILDAVEA